MAERKALDYELDPEYLKKRDLMETLELANLYLHKVRCVGGHLVQQGFCCPHCPSVNPSEVCNLTGVTKQELLDEQQKKIEAYEQKKHTQELSAKGVNEIH